MDGRPQIQHVPLDPTLRLEALKRVLAEMDREGSVPIGRMAVHGTGSTTLRAIAAQLGQEPQMLKNLGHCHLLAQEFEVYLGPRGCGARPRRLDRRRRRSYRGESRGDHFFR